MTDKKIDGDPLEIAICRALITQMAKAGFVPVAVWDDEEYVYAARATAAARNSKHGSAPKVMSIYEVLAAVFAVDVSTIHFARADALDQWGSHGVMFVCGNGEDCISDYHVHKGAWNDTLDAIGKKLTDEKYSLTLEFKP